MKSDSESRGGASGEVAAAAIARTPAPPYYAVIFTSRRAADAPDERGDYDRMSARMVELAAAQPGFLGVESARGGDGVGITVSYWRDEASVVAWKNVAAHLGAQRLGRERWYERYEVRVCRVERAYGMNGNSDGSGA